MTPGLMKMTISLAGIMLMVIASVTIYFSREKLTGFWRIITAFFAYSCMAAAFIIMMITIIDMPSAP